MDSEGVMDDQGKEFKAIVSNGIKIGATLPIVENVPWLRFFCPLDEEAIAKHGARRDSLTKVIMEEHTRARQTGGTKNHFVDALLTLRDEYELSDDTIIGLLWVFFFSLSLLPKLNNVFGGNGKESFLFWKTLGKS